MAARQRTRRQGTRGLVVASGNRAPFLQPGPEVLDEMAVVVDPLWAGHRRIGAPGRDGGACAQVPDALATGIAGEAPLTDNPSGHLRQTAEQPWGKRQFTRLPGASATAIARPRPSAITQDFVP